MSAQHTPCPEWLVMAGANPREKGIHDTRFGHYGVTFATVSFEHEYRHMPEYGAKLAAEYANRIAALPEMLAALQAEEEWRAREAAGALDHEWDYERMVGDKRRAAIAKATGSAS